MAACCSREPLIPDSMGNEQLSAEVREFERSFTRMLENMALASVMLDAQGKIAFINSYLLQMTGYKREEVTGSDWVDNFIPLEKREKIRNTFALISSGLVEISAHTEGEVLTKDGRLIPIAWNNTIMKDAEGRFKGISSIGEDLNKRSQSPNDSNTTNELNNFPLLKNYDRTEMDPVSGNVLGDLVLVKVLKNLAADKGHVQLAVHKDTKKMVAVKSLRKDLMKEEEIDRARREIEIMQQLTQLNNPYIIKLLDAEETPTHFHLVVEYVSGGELVSLILESAGLQELHAQRLFKQLVCAINCCHQNSIVHRDIKLQNILLDGEGNVRLIDFGLSNFVEVGRFRSTFCGTPAYAPPEILLGTQYKGPEVDVWSLGVVLYSMLTAEFPFTTIGEILKGKFKEPTNISSDCLDLLKRMLIVKKETRITLPEVMHHPWVQQNFENHAVPSLTKRESCEGVEPETKRQKTLSINSHF